MEKRILQITTDDTHKTYEFINGGRTEGVPQLWKIELRANAYDARGNCVMDYKWTPVFHTFVVEREFLVKYGDVPDANTGKAIENPRTVENLLLELFEMMGVKTNE